MLGRSFGWLVLILLIGFPGVGFAKDLSQYVYLSATLRDTGGLMYNALVTPPDAVQNKLAGIAMIRIKPKHFLGLNCSMQRCGVILILDKKELDHSFREIAEGDGKVKFSGSVAERLFNLLDFPSENQIKSVGSFLRCSRNEGPVRASVSCELSELYYNAAPLSSIVGDPNQGYLRRSHAVQLVRASGF